ncbi:hypothetical protein R3P38DRAFT_2409077, partial [Favolaschia claudopus]
ASIALKGTFSGTFRVPRLVSVASDVEEHAFTVVEVSSRAETSSMSVLTVDVKAHFNVWIQFVNSFWMARTCSASKYTLLGGVASIYADGSFLSWGGLPAVRLNESFDCTLGMPSS